jgi:GTP 3',8-cyclase
VHAPHDLVDPFGRVVRDLRISVTDRCNFRCTYCMPEEGMQWLPAQELLTFEEIERIARIFVERFGSTASASPAASPRCGRTCPSWWRSCPPAGAGRPRRPSPGSPTALTTNGATFRSSPTTCGGRARPGEHQPRHPRPREVRAITRRDELGKVLDGIAAAKEAGFAPVKINAVVERGSTTTRSSLARLGP